MQMESRILSECRLIFVLKLLISTVRISYNKWRLKEGEVYFKKENASVQRVCFIKVFSGHHI